MEGQLLQNGTFEIAELVGMMAKKMRMMNKLSVS
jgi:hypothetical protein